MSQTPHCCWRATRLPAMVMWSSEENRAIKAITLPPAASSSPWRSRPSGGRGATAVGGGEGGSGEGGGGRSGGAGGDGWDSGSVGPGSAAGDSPGMAGSSAIHQFSIRVLSRSWLAPRRIEAGVAGCEPLSLAVL
jgi:hypothetical protein